MKPLLILLCLLIGGISTLAGQRDTTTISFGGESTTTSFSRKTKSQVANRRMWASLYWRLSQFQVHQPDDNLPDSDQKKWLRYGELPGSEILNDAIVLHAYHNQALYRQKDALAFIDSVQEVMRQQDEVQRRFGELLSQKSDEEPDVITLSEYRRMQERWDEYEKIYLPHPYPIVKPYLWGIDDYWESEYHIKKEDEEVANPVYHKGLYSLIDTLAQQDTIVRRLMGVRSAMDGYQLWQQTTQRLQLGYWSENLMRLPYNRSEVVYSNGETVIEFEDALSERVDYQELEPLRIFQAQIQEALEQYTVKHSQLSHDFADVSMLLDSTERVFFEQMLTSFSVEEAELTDFQLAAQFVLVKAEDEPIVQRFVEMATIADRMEQHLSPMSSSNKTFLQTITDRITQFFSPSPASTPSIDVLAQAIHDRYVQQVWQLNDSFLDKARTYHSARARN